MITVVDPGGGIELPAFDLPFPAAIHPHRGRVLRHTSRWARAVGLVTDASAVRRLRRDGIMDAGPRLVPTAPPKVAYLVCDWTIFLIIVDDEFDERELGARPLLAEAATEDIVAAFRDRAVRREFRLPHLGGAGRAAADLGRRFAAMAPAQEWLRRFWSHAEEHLWSKVLEARQRASRAALDVQSYIRLRRVTGAAYTYADLVELAAQVAIPEPVVASPAWGALLDAFADAFIGIQDICSCAKEIAAGDDLNLAVVMARSGDSAIQQGIDAAYRWVCERSADFAAHRAQLPSLARHLGLDPAAEAGMTRYVVALELLLGGHLAWNSQDNPRYTRFAPRPHLR